MLNHLKNRPLVLAFLAVTALILFLKLRDIPLWDAPRFSESVDTALHRQGLSFTVQGRLSRKIRGQDSTSFLLEGCRLSGTSDVRVSGRILVYCPEEYFSLKIGTEIVCTGKTFYFLPEVNPGTFDAEAYYRSFGCYLYMNADRIRVLSPPKNLLADTLYELKQRIKGVYAAGTDSKSAGVFSRMVLGEKTAAEEEVRENFSVLSLNHMLTGYGFHIPLLGNLLYRGLLRLRMKKGLCLGVTLGLVWSYALFLGDSPAIIRSCLMYTCLLIAKTAVRISYDPASALSLAGLLILLKTPHCLFYQGFQYTFCAACGVLFFYPLFRKKVQERKSRRKRNRIAEDMRFRLASRSLLWLSVNLAILPLSLYYHFTFSLFGFAASLLFMSLAGPVFLLGLFGGLSGLYSLPLAARALFLPSLVIRLEYLSGAAAGKISWAVLILGRPSAAAIAFYAAGMVLFLLLYAKAKGKKAKRLRLLPILCVFVLVLRPPAGFSLTMLDVGQGACTVIRVPGEGVYIFDAGSSSVPEVGEKRVLPYLKSCGIRRIEAILVSHADIDHVNAVADILESAIPVNTLFLPAAGSENGQLRYLASLAERNGTAVIHTARGDRISGREFELEVLNPPKEGNGRSDNENSLVLGLTYRTFTALLTADMEKSAEEAVTAMNRRSFFLAVPHHGSKNSSSEAFLASVQARLAFISCGRNNVYGHPHRETLERLENAGAYVYCTCYNGMLQLRLYADGRVGVITAIS